MADDDEIDILGDFSFNSCFAQNNQGIPSCSDREDTVHPQWLLDWTATNWYDTQNRLKQGSSRKLSGNNSRPHNENSFTEWSNKEREILKQEIAKNGRNVKQIAQTLKSKSEAEIQALIEAEHGVTLDNEYDVPDISKSQVLTVVSTGVPTVTVPQQTKPVDASEIFYDDELAIGSTELVTSDASNSGSPQKYKKKIVQKIGKCRRKHVTGQDKDETRNSIKGGLMVSDKCLQKHCHSDDSLKSQKLQIVLGSGQALPISEGEQVIKIEKNKESEQESDVEIDVDNDDGTETNMQAVNIPEINVSDVETQHKNVAQNKTSAVMGPPLRSIMGPPLRSIMGPPLRSVMAPPLRRMLAPPSRSKMAPPSRSVMAPPVRRLDLARRRRKFNLDGEGGYRILHTEAGDLYEVSSEPRKEKQPRKQPVQLIRCKSYGPDRPAPCEVNLHISTLVSMEVHAHTSRGEVMGLVGGTGDEEGRVVFLTAYQPARAAANSTHCDMDPVSQAMAGEYLRGLGLSVCGWHHSHPQFPAEPS
ncbi:unnamed protein product, partial [Leptidea sinapis]